MNKKNIKDAVVIYNLQNWGQAYFKINSQGECEIKPLADAGASIHMPKLISRIQEKSLRFPVLIRFNDIISHRFSALRESFLEAAKPLAYSAAHLSVYPIKVNQQHSVINSVLKQDAANVGLEAGSKSELMLVLAMAEKERLIICNGYKDKEYIQLALMAQKTGQKIIIVIEKYSELALILRQADALNVSPSMGVRIRLASMGKGKWQNSGGEKSKFGLSAVQILQLIKKLSEHKLLQNLELLHFHMGSQISDLADFKQGLIEAVRCYIALVNAGASMQTLDVGGGLAVDYDGTHSNNMYSMAYSFNEYAAMILHTVKNLCDEEKINCPVIITESGRAMVAHHAMLITDVIDVESRLENSSAGLEGHAIINKIKSLKNKINIDDIKRLLKQVNEYRHQAHDLFSAGEFSLQQRAGMDYEYYIFCKKLFQLIKPEHELWNELSEILADKYFCNLSIFQSMPDVWGIDQVFPIMPLQRLNEAPTRRAILYDLTCDSDGHIEYYADQQGIKSTLPLHEIKPQEKYYLGMFLLGAYQEILGDMHNLFGDTDAVDVRLTEEGGFELVDEEWGDTTEQLLNYVHFNTKDMLRAYQNKINEADLNQQDKQEFLAVFEEALQAYTYFSKS